MARMHVGGAHRVITFEKALREAGWVTWLAGSTAVILALRAGAQPRLIKVTTARHPLSRFNPSDRKHLIARAAKAGAEPQLVWCPRQGPSMLIDRSEWS
jgi:hypothetical protein